MTLTPFPPIISPPNAQFTAPNLLMWTHIHFKKQITGLFAMHVGIQGSQRIHIFSFLLFSLYCPNTARRKVKQNKTFLFSCFPWSQFSWFSIKMQNQIVCVISFDRQVVFLFLCHTQHKIHENSDGTEGNPHYIRASECTKPSTIHPL